MGQSQPPVGRSARPAYAGSFQYKDADVDASPGLSHLPWTRCRGYLDADRVLLELSPGGTREIQVDTAFKIVAENVDTCTLQCTFHSHGRPRLAMVQTKDLVQLADMKDALLRLKRPVWQKANQCSLCRNAFTFTSRRHHCRNCGQSVCSGCSAGKHWLVQLGYESKQRICRQCKISGLPSTLNRSSSLVEPFQSVKSGGQRPSGDHFKFTFAEQRR